MSAPTPYVAPRVEEALSLGEVRILRVITNLKIGAKKQTGAGGYVCNPGGYDRIAKNAGVCRKTAYNIIKSLQRKGALREMELVMRGGQRVRTIYFAPSYKYVLDAWRGDETIKTSRGSVVVRGRAKRIFRIDRAAVAASIDKANPEMDVADRDAALSSFTYATDWHIDQKRAPKRGSGPGRNPGEDDQADLAFSEQDVPIADSGDSDRSPVPTMPDPPKVATAASYEELAALLDGFQEHTPACLQDAMDLLASARENQGRYPWPVTVKFILDACGAIRRAYEPNPKHPVPTPKWFISRIGGRIAHAMSQRRARFVHALPPRYSREDQVLFLADADIMRDWEWASAAEKEFCDRWIEYYAANARDLWEEALGRRFGQPDENWHGRDARAGAHSGRRHDSRPSTSSHSRRQAPAAIISP